MKRFFCALIFFTLLIGIWHGIFLSGKYSPVVLPSPSDVAIYLMKSLSSGDLGMASWITLKRLMLGYCIGCIIGLPLGLLTARSHYLSDTVGVLALGLQTLPSVCWVPLALLWYGQTEGAMLFVVIMGTLWSVLISVDNGVKNLPPIYVRAARTMGSEGLHTLVKVVLPASLPYIVSGMKQGWAFAWRSLMAAEIYVTILNANGLGQLLHNGREINDMSQVVGIMLVIIFIGILADKALFAPWEKLIRHRWGMAQT
jgi:NitT/TauT family transport system permease protein